MEYFDDLASGQCTDQPPVSGLPAIAVKNLHLTGVKAYCDEFPAACRTTSHMFNSESVSESVIEIILTAVYVRSLLHAYILPCYNCSFSRGAPWRTTCKCRCGVIGR